MTNNILLCALFMFFSACRNNTLSENPFIIGFILDLNKSEFICVSKAKDSLIKYGEMALPYLIAELKNENKYVKLQNTNDLIYPGATEYYGSGWIMDYDIDWLNIRIGWVIEEITFKDFGFRENSIYEKDLFKMQIDLESYSDYIESGKYDSRIRSRRVKEIKKIVKNVNKWWNNNSVSWNRLKGITEALKRNNMQEQLSALNYLRFGNFMEFHITELTQEYYDNNLKSVVENLSKSENADIKMQAKLLLGDYKWNKNISKFVIPEEVVK